MLYMQHCLYICPMKYELQNCIGANIRSLSRVVDNYYRSCLSSFDITENQMTILFTLSKMGKVEQGRVGDELVLERSTVSRNIKLLEKKGLLTRTAVYRPEIELSKKGQELVLALIPGWEKVMEELSNKIGADTVSQIQELEKKLK